MEDVFNINRSGNITFEGHVFLITRQLRGEIVEQFFGELKDLAENYDFENKEETLISDVFITNLIDPEIQKELLKQTIEPRQVLELDLYGTRHSIPAPNSTAQQDIQPGKRERDSVSKQPPIIKLVLLKQFPQTEQKTPSMLLKLRWELAA